MRTIRMISESLMHGDKNSHNDYGIIKENGLVFSPEELKIDWTETTVTINNGVNLELNKVTDSSIKTEKGWIDLKTKLTELTIEDNRIIFIYEIIVDEEVKEKRKLEYRW